MSKHKHYTGLPFFASLHPFFIHFLTPTKPYALTYAPTQPDTHTETCTHRHLHKHILILWLRRTCTSRLMRSSFSSLETSRTT
jgi:lipopolysaccharide biosynthesis glycosyltransferase